MNNDCRMSHLSGTDAHCVSKRLNEREVNKLLMWLDNSHLTSQTLAHFLRRHQTINPIRHTQLQSITRLLQ